MLLLITIFFVCICGMNFSVLLPVLIHTVMNSNETGLGIMMSCMGAGAFFGALSVATKSKSGPSKFFLQIGPFIIAAVMIITSFSNIFILSGVLIAGLGYFLISFTATANTSVQLLTDDEHRGRVMSFYSLVLVGSTPIGNIITGTLLDRFGVLMGFRILGITLGIVFLLYILIKRMVEKKNRIH